MPQPISDARPAAAPLQQALQPAALPQADATALAPVSQAAATQTFLHDPRLQAVHRAVQSRQRAQAESLALQARNAHD